MEPSSRRTLGRVAPALVLALPLLALAILFASSKADGQIPGPTMITSPNVTFVRNIAEASDGVGARVAGNRLFVTTTKDLLVYDISNPTDPKNVGGINVNVEFENEEVPTNGKLLGISGQIGGCQPAGLTPVVGTSCLVIYDVSGTAPKPLSIVPGAGDHTQTCVLDCTYFYGSSGTIVDARDPRKPVVLRDAAGAKLDWHRKVGGSCHHQNEIRPGVIAAACQPMFVVSVRPEDGGSITEPKLLQKYAHDDKRFIHGLRWPNEGADKFALAGGETNFEPRCTPEVGAFMVFDTKTPSKQGSFTQTDEVRPQNGNYLDGSGNGQAQALGCSVHWFEEQQSFKNGGLVALAEYEQGTRFLQVTPEGKLRQLGFALPVGGSTSAPHWAPDGRTVYAIDYTRGLDVLRYEGPLVVPDEQGRVERPEQVTAPGEQPLSEQGAGATPAVAGGSGSSASAAAPSSCEAGTGFTSVKVAGSAVRVQRRLQRPFSFSLFQQSSGRRVVSNRLSARVRRSTASSLTLPSRDRSGKRLDDGVYLARVTMDLPRVDDVRRIVLSRKGGRWSVRPDAYLRATCGALSAFKLDRAVFGGRSKRALRVSYRLPRGVDAVTLEVVRGTKVVRRLQAGAAGRAYRFSVPASVARAGQDVRVRIRVRRAGTTVTETLVARRL